VSRAVRTPSRADDGITLDLVGLPPRSSINPLPFPGLTFFRGNPAFTSETLTAYELGYRVLPSERLSLDFTAFYNDYGHLRAFERRLDASEFEGGWLRVPLLFVNVIDGHSHGVELAGNWQVAEGWRLQLAYSYLRVNFDNQPEISDTALRLPVREGSQPRHQVSLLSSFDIRDDLDFDLWLRYVDEVPDLAVGALVPTVAVDSYFSVNARLGWRPRKDLELSLVGTNLLGPSHVEYVQETYPFPEQVERAVYGQMRWSF